MPKGLAANSPCERQKMLRQTSKVAYFVKSEDLPLKFRRHVLQEEKPA